jgi:chaperone modulatory protein CbpM
MTMHDAEWWWLDERQAVSLPELARVCGMSPAELGELVDDGVLVPASGAGAAACFTADLVHPLREAARVRAQFDLDLFTMGLLAGYLHRIELLEQQVRVLQGRVHAPPHSPRDGPATWREPHT